MSQTLTALEYQERAKEYAVYPKGHLDRNYQAGRIPDPYPLTAGQTYCLLGLASELGEAVESDWESKELGDVAWYVAMLGTETGVNLPVGPHTVYSSFSFYVVLSNVMGAAKKLVRDGTPPNWEWLVLSTWEWVKYKAEQRGLDLYRDVLPANIAKLADRKARGVIQGSGDNR